VIRLALFDIDGTLIRTGGAGVQAFARAMALEFGVADGTRGISFAGRTDTSLVRQCFRLHGIEETAGNFGRFFDAYVFLLQDRLTQCKGAPCSGVMEFLMDLRTLPTPPVVGLLTGNIRLGAEIKLRHFGLWEFFETGAFGDDHEDRNQLAAIAHRRGAKLVGNGLAGSEILVVGDTPLDIACANSIQARMLAVGTGGCECEVLRACSPAPTWVVSDLRELSAHEVCCGRGCA
jgi:phosphoglycolate phosphatase-like HAD superfamily hydrolase